MKAGALLVCCGALALRPALVAARPPAGTQAPCASATQGSLHAAARAGDAASPAVTEIVELRPTVLVVPSGAAYLVLRAGPDQRDGVLTWGIVYLAGRDAAELSRPDGRARVAAMGRDLVAAYGPIVDVTHVERVSVTAIAGSGAGAVVERSWFTREPAGWRPDAAATERTVTQLPALAPAAREPDQEASAREAAAVFISDVDRADWDAAWARASAVVRAGMSRVEFERRLASIPPGRPAHDSMLYVSYPATPQRLLPGASMVAWVSRETAAGPAVATLELRLDDDLVWRVSGIVVLAAGPPRSPPGEEREPAIASQPAL